MSPSAAAAVPMSSSLKPAHFVAQYTALCSFDIATMFPASTSRSRPEQAVPVLHEVGRFGARHRRLGDAAGERGDGMRRRVRILLREAVGAEVERAAGRSVAGEVVRDAVGALDEPGQAVGSRGRR